MNRRFAIAFVLAASACADPPPASAPSPPPSEPAPLVTTSSAVVYRLSFPTPASHTVEVEASFPTHHRPELVLAMPVWTPGSYLVREYTRNVESFSAEGSLGRPRDVKKVRKNRFRIALDPKDGRVVVRYRLYAREPSVRTNFVDAEHTVINGAATFMFDVNESRHYEVELVPFETWPHVATALRAIGARRFSAESFDELADSPILLGTMETERFELDNKPITLAQLGVASGLDLARAAKDTKRIMEETHALFGTSPYQSYVFLSVLNEARGGLEHASSTLLMSSRAFARTREGYLRFLGLVAHEHFHAWNGKKLRPLELGPFDYENEVYTESLWFVEGFTSYYDMLLVARAGLATEVELLQSISGQIKALDLTPGRSLQSLSRSSYDAWIKFYRPDESSANTAVSYYDKGALVAFILDAKIREASRDAKSLDDVMYEAYRRWSGTRGYRSDELLNLVGEIGGVEAQSFLDRAVAGTDELDLAQALRYYGLRFKAGAQPPKDGGPDGEREWRRKRTHLGAEAAQRDGRWIVARVTRGGPAYEAGVEPEDELIGIDELRFDATGLDKRIELYQPGEKVELTLARRGLLKRVAVVLGEKSPPREDLERDPNSGARERGRLEALLRSRLTRR